MRMRLALIILTTVVCSANPVLSKAPGTITIDARPYHVVNTLPELAAAIAARPSGSFALGADYDASVDGVYMISPIPTVFTGKFDGLGHTISNLSIHVPAHQSIAGLFADIGVGGVVRNINLSNASIESQTNGRRSPVVGSVAAANEGSITNANVTGSLVAGRQTSAGGLVGANSGSIVRSSADVAISVDGSSYVGGLVGVVSGGMVKGSHASGNVVSGRLSRAGGLVGNVTAGTIVNSYATNSVLMYPGAFGVAGGLIGYNAGTITVSFATGSADITCCGEGGDNNIEVGGLVGENAGTVSNVYSTGAVETAGSDHCNIWGGLLGTNEGHVSNAYSTGEVERGNDCAGGFVGADEQQITDAFWDFDTSGVTDPTHGAGEPLNDPGITGMTTAQFLAGLPAGFDHSVWGQNSGINGGFPYLLANPPQ